MQQVLSYFAPDPVLDFYLILLFCWWWNYAHISPLLSMSQSMLLQVWAWKAQFLVQVRVPASMNMRFPLICLDMGIPSRSWFAAHDPACPWRDRLLNITVPLVQMGQISVIFIPAATNCNERCWSVEPSHGTLCQAIVQHVSPFLLLCKIWENCPSRRLLRCKEAAFHAAFLAGFAGVHVSPRALAQPPMGCSS